MLVLILKAVNKYIIPCIQLLQSAGNTQTIHIVGAVSRKHARASPKTKIKHAAKSFPVTRCGRLGPPIPQSYIESGTVLVVYMRPTLQLFGDLHGPLCILFVAREHDAKLRKAYRESWRHE